MFLAYTDLLFLREGPLSLQVPGPVLLSLHPARWSAVGLQHGMGVAAVAVPLHPQGAFLLPTAPVCY